METSATVEKIADEYYAFEGYGSPQDYLDALVEEYPDATFDEVLQLHWFRKMSIIRDYGEIARALDKEVPSTPHITKLVDVIKTKHGRYTRKTTNYEVGKAKRLDRRTAEWKAMQATKTSA